MDLCRICDSVDKWQENGEIDSCKTQVSADGNLLYHES